jgi:PEP-CTERM motif
MSFKLPCILALSLVMAALTPAAHADTIIGYISFDVTSPPSQGQFDIVGQSGPNSSGDATFPVTTTVGLSALSLDVSFMSGPDEIFGSSYFTADLDGESFDGGPLALGSLSGAVKAVLTGTFTTTSFLLFDGTTISVDPTFSATISDPTGLVDGDLAFIGASPSGSGPPPPSSLTPEPETFVMVGSGLAGLIGLRRRYMATLRGFCSRKVTRSGATLALTVVFFLAAGVAAYAQSVVKLNTLTSPSSGLAGSAVVSITGSGFPSGSINPSAVTLSFSKTCGGSAAATEAPRSVSAILGTTDRAQFLVPASLSSGDYFVSIAGTSVGGTSFSSSNCSEINVTLTTTTLAACVPTSSLAVTVGKNVTAYVPFGYWSGGTRGIEQVPLEGSGTTMNFTTPGVVNSCASNSVTDEVVCTENTTNVDLINGTTLTTVTSGSNAFASFSGGECENCGVAINPSNNTAVIAMGVVGAASNQGVQVVNLAGNTFNKAFPMVHAVSENISIDSGRNLILSPGEGGVYDLLKIGPGNTLTEYGNSIGGTLDSAAEDCTTGIAMSADEFTDSIYITDLTQAAFTAGTPGTWTAPGQFINLNDGDYSAGTSGITSAPGTGHLAVVTGEFGGSSYSALRLPSTSGSGTPTLADHAYVASMPTTPDGRVFSAGFDPHTITAYTSPNTGKSYAVFVDYATGTPSYLGVVDLACVLALPRTLGTHNVTGSTSSCTRYVGVP